MLRLVAFLVAMAMPASALAQSCPEPLASAQRLALVTAPGMNATAGSAALFERGPGQPWRRAGGASKVDLGRNGLAWGAGFAAYARRGEPIKREGDKRTPAGVYKIGRPFGFGPSARANYLQLRRDETYCVDDVRSRAYNTITTLAKAGPVSGERMGNIPWYRRGLLVSYPSNARRPAGSCIFVHLAHASPTSGCVAMDEGPLERLQDFAGPGAVIAVLPRSAIATFGHCLPAEAGDAR